MRICVTLLASFVFTLVVGKFVILELQKIYEKYFSDNNTPKKEKGFYSLSGIASSLFSSSKDSLGEEEIKERLNEAVESWK